MNSQSSKDKDDQAAENEQPPAVTVNPSHKPSGAKPTKKKTKPPRDQAYWEKRQYRVQRLIAWAGVFGIIIYALQLYYMKKATDAATQANRASRDYAQLEQRAWINKTGATVVKPPAVGEKVVVSVTLMNSGRTPAMDMHGIGRVFGKPALELVPSDLADTTGSQKEISKTVVGSTTTVTILVDSGEPLANQAQVDALKSGEISLFASGTIYYADIFGKSHKTEFCYRITGQAEFDRNNMVSCEIGNTCD